MTNSVTQEYLDGIREGRATLNRDKSGEHAQVYLENLNATIKGFPASNPVGQFLRGERDFWRNQIKLGK